MSILSWRVNVSSRTTLNDVLPPKTIQQKIKIGFGALAPSAVGGIPPKHGDVGVSRCPLKPSFSSGLRFTWFRLPRRLWGILVRLTEWYFSRVINKAHRAPSGHTGEANTVRDLIRRAATRVTGHGY
jgi:hypothetical protein